MKKNLLVTIADKNFIKQAKQLFSSVYWNAGWQGDYMLLAQEIPEKDLKWFRDKGILIKICKPISTKKTIGILNNPIVVLIKFYLFTKFFKNWDKIIYLDSDVIVRGPLEELTKTKGLAAYNAKYGIFQSFRLYDQFSKTTNKKMYNRLKKELDSNPYSFNAGIMAFNTNIIKKDTFTKIKKLYERYKKISIHNEESILNLFFYKKWKKISQVYNLRPDHIKRCVPIKEKNIKGIILHFLGEENRPWKPQNYFYKEWKNNLKKAELIDLKKRVKKWNKLKMKVYCFYIKFKLSCLLKKIQSTMIRKSILQSILPSILESINRAIGLIGLFLKRYFPLLYIKLRKIKGNLGFK
jgi:lipopolysaccharide biosynthesis glycosyltransferase